jgi:ABC-type nitrate/sulfonate/bicarbonate transport system ATPase subunit
MAQRVALARALANDPDVLLLDEPLGALDAQTRFELQDELARILAVRRLSALIVTHDFDEALVLADRILVLSSAPGRIAREIPVALPHPRDRASHDLLAVRATVVSEVRAAWRARVA